MKDPAKSPAIAKGATYFEIGPMPTTRASINHATARPLEKANKMVAKFFFGGEFNTRTSVYAQLELDTLKWLGELERNGVRSS